MATTLLRILKYGFQIFWRNGWVSLAAVVVMILALSIFHFLIIFSVVTDEVIAALYDKIDIAVYFKSNSAENDILQLQSVLKELAEVSNVEYISQARALDLFKERHKEDTAINQALTELGENPLLASLNIKARDPEYYQDIAAYLENENLASLIEKVTYSQNRTAIERMLNIVGTFRQFGLALTIFLALTAALVTFNTIRLAIYSNREEIGIMRLVGASNIFINGPYVVNGILYGVLAGLFSLVIAAPLLILASPYATAFIPELDLRQYFWDNIFLLFGYQLLFGVFLGVVSSVWAVRRYLKI